MNYNSVEQILSAGTTNMTALRSNSKQDDGVDTITGASWLTFNGTTVNSIYASGNSFLGFGSNSEHLKVNRRDGALYYLYREEGTLYNYYRFIKIRWDGYTAYNDTSSSYKITYDVILWDTGDISLHMVNVPTSQNNGIYSLVTSSGTYNYTVSSSSRDVTFTKTETGYTVSNNVINLQMPFEKRYLIRSGSTYYTVVDNALSELSITELTSSAFLNFGTEVAPQYYLLADLTSPEILYWVDKDSGIPTNGLIVTGDPTLPQVIYYNNQNIPSEQCIDSIEVFSKSVLFAVSFDNGQTWKYHNGTSWVDTASVSEGMNGDNIKNITRAQWSEVTSSDSLKFRASLTALDSYASHKVYFNFAPLQ